MLPRGSSRIAGRIRSSSSSRRDGHHIPQEAAAAAIAAMIALPSSFNNSTTLPPPPCASHGRPQLRRTACRSSPEKGPSDGSNCASRCLIPPARLDICRACGGGSGVAKLAAVTLAAAVLAIAPVDGAAAAKSGGRVGGQAFRSAAPRGPAPRINNSRTNVFINPPVAPPLVGGYGYGYGYGGGWGWSPFTFFAPGPGVAVGFGGFEFFVAFLALSFVASAVRRFLGRGEEEDDDY